MARRADVSVIARRDLVIVRLRLATPGPPARPAMLTFRTRRFPSACPDGSGAFDLYVDAVELGGKLGTPADRLAQIHLDSIFPRYSGDAHADDLEPGL